MNWDAIGAVGELIGALAVVISVIYLAVQIRTGSAAVSTNLRDSIFSSLHQWNYQLTADPQFAAMFHRGLQDFELLTDEEKPRFLHTAFGFFKVFENIYIHYLDGAVGADAWVQNREILFMFSQLPGGQFYWRERAAAFDPRFIAELESVTKLKMKTSPEILNRDAK